MTEQLNIFKQGLTEEEFRVWEVVSQRRGRESAIGVSTVAFQARMTDVQVRSIVSDLVRNHGKLIGSATGNPPGLPRGGAETPKIAPVLLVLICKRVPKVPSPFPG